MRPILIAILLAWPALATAQQARLTAADSALVGRILLAEDRRDAADPALEQGLAHRDPRVRVIAERARGRIADSLFVARAGLPPLPPPPSWPEPDWRLRYRALAPHRDDCPALLEALGDPSWPVRLRAADLAGPGCADNSPLVTILRGWVDDLPDDASARPAGGVSWHAAAHGIVALARIRPEEARRRVAALARHRQWQVRVYTARAAALLGDAPLLRRLVRDRDDNVKEAAIDGLARLTGHQDDELYLAALDSRGAQAVRAAALALKGSPRAEVSLRAMEVFHRWVAHRNASERDARQALLEAAGRSPAEDQPPPPVVELPEDAVALALGKEARLRVTLSPANGGGSFVVRLRGDVAPVMAGRILALARAGYYDRTSWHRVEPDFVIQGGGPGANEYIGNARFLRDELGSVPHVRGTVGMSTRGHDTGDAQWFVNLKDNLRLGRDYTVFAEVVEGIDVVDGIMEGDIIARIRPVGR